VWAADSTPTIPNAVQREFFLYLSRSSTGWGYPGECGPWRALSTTLTQVSFFFLLRRGCCRGPSPVRTKPRTYLPITDPGVAIHSTSPSFTQNDAAESWDRDQHGTPRAPLPTNNNLFVERLWWTVEARMGSSPAAPRPPNGNRTEARPWRSSSFPDVARWRTSRTSVPRPVDAPAAGTAALMAHGPRRWPNEFVDSRLRPIPGLEKPRQLVPPPLGPAGKLHMRFRGEAPLDPQVLRPVPPHSFHHSTPAPRQY